MARISEEWGTCIRGLLKAHGLTLRGAMLRAGGKPSHMTIKDWCDNVVPGDSGLAIRFLATFTREEAIPCLQAAGIPVPADWLGAGDVESELADVLRRVRASGIVDPQNDEEIVRIVREKLKELRREQ